VSRLDHLALLDREVAGMQTALAATDPAAPVPACGDWTVRDVAHHVTTLHRWVRDALDSPTMPAFDERPVDGDGPAIAEAYRESAAAMLSRMHELPLDHPCWTFDKDNQTAGFWHRRQLHELSVHRWDVAPYDLADELASDGIDEALEFMLPRMLAGGRASLPDGSLRLVSPKRTWTVGEGEPVAEVQGSASDLLLSLWGRRDLLPSPWREAKLMP
jgi:uncharacterized protein (TIGR03083 family)